LGSTVEHITKTAPARSAAAMPRCAVQDGLGLFRVDHHADHDVAGGRHVGQGGARHPAIGRESRGHARPDVIGMHLVAGAAQALRDAGAHGAQADDADAAGKGLRMAHGFKILKIEWAECRKLSAAGRRPCGRG
jgi:hypothetical protein